MLLGQLKKDVASRSVYLKVIDNTTGLPVNSLAYNSTGIALWYRRDGAAVTDITEVTLAAVTTAWTSGGFIYLRDGVYRLDVPDAAFATGVNQVYIGGTFTGYTVIGGVVQLVDIDMEDAVRQGMTALPNAAAEAAGGLYTRGTGAGQINQPFNGMSGAYVVQIAASAIDVASIHASTYAAIAADVWAYVIDGVNTALKLFRGVSAVLLGKASGMGTTTATFRDVPDSKNVIVATVDVDGNRTAVTRTLT